ncbi:MAG: RNA polymerase subunit sigma-24 [Ilumatobacter coccineus]|uniref:RNA polymerase subunit sigma-24 n=1 Tax=Ilumatobacter coccineus TaxID=467094 RepID=A0A2G6K7V0_9ACTN|nr:MAG: RNA polymerase subunit sigma-24 [Ilumatobacter coccineus]
MTRSDSALITAAQAGDRDALEQLLRDHYDRIHAVCRRIAGSDRDADDAVQETMIRIVRSLNSFDGRSKLSTWIYRIATNAALDELRRRSRRPSLSLTSDPEVSVELPDPGAHDQIDSIADRMTIDAALNELPDSFRTVVVLRDLADLDYADIADIVGIPVGTVKSRISRGRHQLGELLGNPSPPPERPTSRPTP